ncbi:MAG: hypothetical protein VX938_13545, partial [Myxococcota bacterium]|nr:hypothetical protein [Myxococcota bacterium]
QEVIDATRSDTGWEIPWGVALAAWLPGLEAAPIQAVLDGQQAVIDTDPLTFQGPTTEDLIGPEWRWDDVHFSHAGLMEHAKRWDAQITLPSCQGFIEGEDCPEPPPTTPTAEPEADGGSTVDSTSGEDAQGAAETTGELGPHPDQSPPGPEEDAPTQEPDIASAQAPASSKASGCKGHPAGESPQRPLWLLGAVLWLAVSMSRRHRNTCETATHVERG